MDCIPGGLSIIIPVYNEAANIVPLIAEIQQVLSAVPQYEIIIVDDASTDATAFQVENFSAPCSVKLLKHSQNFGQSAALITGIHAAQYSWIATLDGDGQNNPHDLLKFIAVALQRSNSSVDNLVCFGIRTARQDQWLRRMSSKIANHVRRFFLKDHCPDSGCGIKLFPKTLFMKIPHFKNCHRFLPVLFNSIDAECVNIPVDHRPRAHGVSKYGMFNRLGVGIIDLFGVAWLIRRIYKVNVYDL